MHLMAGPTSLPVVLLAAPNVALRCLVEELLPARLAKRRREVEEAEEGAWGWLMEGVQEGGSEGAIGQAGSEPS